MSSFSQKIIKKLYLNQAHGQLVAIIICPIFLLMCLGSWVVYNETEHNYRVQQRYVLYAIFSQNHHRIVEIMKAEQNHLDQAKIELLLRPLLSEKNILSVQWVNDRQSVHIGEPLLEQDFQFYTYLKNSQKNIKNAQVLQSIEVGQQQFFAYPLQDVPRVYNTWLVVQVDNQELTILQYRVVVILLVTIFLTLIFLFFALFYYARHWLNPLYKVRLQMQRLTSSNLGEFKIVSSSGEVWALQQDILNCFKRLEREFNELNLYVQETDDDTRRNLDLMDLKLVESDRNLQTLRSTNQSKSIFLANISHELRTPLNSIEGFVQLLLRQQHLGAEQRLYLETIKKSSAHLLALINDVLDYSKIEAGKLQLDMHWFNLENAMYDVLDMLSPLAAQKNLQLIFYYPLDVPSLVLGDELRFKQILMNLVSNAIKFTPDGEIIVRCRVERQQQADYLLHFSVQDSGIGIHGHDRHRLFDSFSQADTSITRQYGGTGLGLAIAKQLAYLMQGSIGFEDNQLQVLTAKGTTFWFTARFKANSIPALDQFIDAQNIAVIYYLQHPATASVLRYYLDEACIHYQEADTAFDFFALLNELDYKQQNQWVILDYSANMATTLSQIRERYQGYLAVYGDQISMDMELLKYYQVFILPQPIHRQALWQLFERKSAELNATHDQLDGQHLHILAVDDHMLNLLVLEALLQEFNIQLIKATSGQEALSLIEQRIHNQQPLFDLIFMDIQMPVMSGLDTTRAIRSLESTLNEVCQMPIIALSAHILAEEQPKLRECGMNDELVKPVQLEALMQILQRWTNITKKLVHHSLVKESKNIEQNQQDNKVLDWAMSLQLSNQKADLAKSLLQMLVNNFAQEQQEIADLIELEDFPQLEQILHRIYGATRYVGTPNLQQITGEFEQFIRQLRLQQRSADDEFAEQVKQRFEQLKQAMQAVENAVQNLNSKL